MKSPTYRLLYTLILLLCTKAVTASHRAGSLQFPMKIKTTDLITKKERDRKIEIEKNAQTQTAAILKKISREIFLSTTKEDPKSIAHILQNPQLLQIISGYTALQIAHDSAPSYRTNLHGIINPHNLCYIIAPAQLAWALQSSLYKRNRLPTNIGQGGSDVCTLLTTALKEHEKQEKTTAASPAELLFALRDWLELHASDVYLVEKDQQLEPNTKGFAYKVLELYLKHLNEQCKDSGMLAPCPTIRLLDGSSNYPNPIIQFMPQFAVEDSTPESECEEGIKSALIPLFPYYPLVLNMVPIKFNSTTQITAFPITVKIETSRGTVKYLLRGALLHDRIISHTVTLIRQDAPPLHGWFICDNHTTTPFDKDWIELANTYNTVLVEHCLPTNIIYERQ
jgi:hypothetical protein